MPPKLTWTRTVIAGDEMHEDFTAHDDKNGRKVGRIYRHHTGGIAGGRWFWAMQANGPDIDRSHYATSGTVDGKQDAAEAVKLVYEACMRR